MRIFDPHIHMTSRTTDDYEAMYAAGVRALVEPSFWLGQPRTSPASFYDYFDSLLGWEPFRAAQYGIAHHCTLALNPKEANDPRCLPVLDELPRYLVKDGVVAVGEIGYDSMTPAEDTALAAQLQLAADHGLPALVHTPHRDKAAGLARTLDVLRESALPPERVVLDHLNETTVRRGHRQRLLAGLLHLPRHQDGPGPHGARCCALHGTERVLVNSAADWGRSDPLKTRARRRRDARRRLHRGRRRPGAVAQPRRLLRTERPAGPRRQPPATRRPLHEGNSILRGGE